MQNANQEMYFIFQVINDVLKSSAQRRGQEVHLPGFSSGEARSAIVVQTRVH
jgi:hypothetical protein